METPQMDATRGTAEYRLTGALLLAGGALFIVGASFPPPSVFSSDVIEHLTTVGGHRARWLANAAGMGLGSIVALFGLVLLTERLREKGDRGLSTLAMAAMGFGTVVWIVSLAFRFSLSDWAAHELAATGVVPIGYAAWWRWAGVLSGVYLVLGWLAVAAWGAAFLRTGLVPRWLGLGSLITGGAGTLAVSVALALGGPSPPFLLYLMPLVTGIIMMRHPPSPATLDRRSSGSPRVSNREYR